MSSILTVPLSLSLCPSLFPAELRWAAVRTKQPVPRPAGSVPGAQPRPEAAALAQLPGSEDAGPAAPGTVPPAQRRHGPVLQGQPARPVKWESIPFCLCSP